MLSACNARGLTDALAKSQVSVSPLTRISILSLTLYESHPSQKIRVATNRGEVTQFNLMLSLVLHFLSIMTGTDTEHRVVLLENVLSLLSLSPHPALSFLFPSPPLSVLPHPSEKPPLTDCPSAFPSIFPKFWMTKAQRSGPRRQGPSRRGQREDSLSHTPSGGRGRVWASPAAVLCCEMAVLSHVTGLGQVVLSHVAGEA